MKKILAIIPARGGSKRILKKNIRKINGKPLIQYTIDLVKKINKIDKIIVSTDDEEIKIISTALGVQVINRDKEISGDKSTPSELIENVLFNLKKEEYEPDIIIYLQPTSPLRNKKDILKSINEIEKKGADSTQTITPITQHPAFIVRLKKGNKIQPYDKKNHLKRTQDLENLYIKTGSVFAFTAKTFKKTKNIYGKKHTGVIIPIERSVDIDYERDLDYVEYLMGKNKFKK